MGKRTEERENGARRKGERSLVEWKAEEHREHIPHE